MDYFIPIRDKRGNLVAQAQVDEEYQDLLVSLAWHLTNGVPATYIKLPGPTTEHITLPRLLRGVFKGDTARQVDNLNGDLLDCRLENLSLPYDRFATLPPPVIPVSTILSEGIHVSPESLAEKKRYGYVPSSFSRLSVAPSAVKVYRPGDSDYPLS